ncbi:ABC-type transport auxiliary lipoprotein family protein [Marinobacter oulmenensis]|uniref:Cholesterol transport system auxiliary component n=1 Tax=Marinobacter oulmenensis TaxID=643747 RepID=A0A840UAZ6_9GAMM|nr:ABC-type transport auxiliary lipoprotein family protein [Marinobacter oulmenensis]MBB5320430.1 cholesterol transport system auxiliary component [Marinobacter oulmenensis]
MIKPARKLAMALAIASLSACTLLPKSDPPRVVDLTSDAAFPAPEPQRGDTVRVETPLASSPLSGTLVLIKPESYEYQAIPGVRWRDSLPTVVEDFLVQRFRASRGFANVISATSPATATISLVSELDSFHAQRIGPAPTVVVAMHSELMDNRTRETLCVTDQTIEIPASSTAVQSLMPAFSEGAERLARHTLEWAHACLAER